MIHHSQSVVADLVLTAQTPEHAKECKSLEKRLFQFVLIVI